MFRAVKAAKVRPALWAPWRMEYILKDKKKGPCVFCAHAKAARGKWASQHVLAASARSFVCLNRYPFAPCHLLVIPKRHVADVADLDDDEYDDLMRLTRASLAALRAAVRPGGVNVGANLGTAAGAGIADHVHLHIVPRWDGDTNFMPTLADVRVFPQHLDATYATLAPRFKKLAATSGARAARGTRRA